MTIRNFPGTSINVSSLDRAQDDTYFSSRDIATDSNISISQILRCVCALRQRRQSLKLPSYQRLLLFPAPPFHLLFPRNRLVDIPEDAHVYQLHRSALECIATRVHALLMLPESMQVVVGDTGVVAAVGAAEDVDEIVTHTPIFPHRKVRPLTPFTRWIFICQYFGLSKPFLPVPRVRGTGGEFSFMAAGSGKTGVTCSLLSMIFR